MTTEANPETVDERKLADLRAGGFTRVSLGMQSAVPHVLTVLDRVHSPGRPEQCVGWARAAGFDQVSLDLIYGTPGETDADWRISLDRALAAGADHISAYSLIVEEGTRLAARIRRGELPAPDDDVLADRYVIADERLAAAGLSWYEVSNWAASPKAECRHNQLYWTGGDWWGVGPGAHSHIAGTRWWNVRHPAAYAQRLSADMSPGQAREILTDAEQATERIMLLTRLAAGCPLSQLSIAGPRGCVGGRRRRAGQPGCSRRGIRATDPVGAGCSQTRSSAGSPADPYRGGKLAISHHLPQNRCAIVADRQNGWSVPAHEFGHRLGTQDPGVPGR